jgi:hypothetical protein
MKPTFKNGEKKKVVGTNHNNQTHFSIIFNNGMYGYGHVTSTSFHLKLSPKTTIMDPH